MKDLHVREFTVIQMNATSGRKESESNDVEIDTYRRSSNTV